MNPGNNFQAHIRKSSSQEISNSSFHKNDIKEKIIYNQINKRNINSNRTRTPFHEENKYNPLKLQNSSFEPRQSNNYSKYTSNTHNPLLIINNRRNKEENSKNENMNNTSIYISNSKRTLNKKYNLSDDNLFKFRNSGNKNAIVNNQPINRRSNQISLDMNNKNNNINNKYVINEELNNKNSKNLQTKTTRVFRNNNQNSNNSINNSNNNNSHQEINTNRRLNLKSV